MFWDPQPSEPEDGQDVFLELFPFPFFLGSQVLSPSWFHWEESHFLLSPFIQGIVRSLVAWAVQFRPALSSEVARPDLSSSLVIIT